MKSLKICLILAVVFFGQAHAQFAKPEDAVKYRKSALFMMGQHFGRLAGMAQGRVPFDSKTAQENAVIVETLSQLPWVAFVEGTDKGETKALPDIWKENAKFKELAEKLQAETLKLATAAKTGKQEDLKQAVGGVGAACKSCHDSFRAK
jgi:cytochrome c556